MSSVTDVLLLCLAVLGGYLLVHLFWLPFLLAERRRHYDSPVERAVRWNEKLYGKQLEVR